MGHLGISVVEGGVVVFTAAPIEAESVHANVII